MEEIDSRIRKILLKLVSEDELKVSIVRKKEVPDFVDDLDFDSIMIITFIVMIEEEFGVSFEQENVIDIVWDFEELKRWLQKNI